MTEDKAINYNRRLIDFTCKLFAVYRMENDEELVFNSRNLHLALKIGLEDTLSEYEDKDVPRSIQEVESTLSFVDGSYGLICRELGDILAYSHMIGILHPQPPTFNDERIFLGKRWAKETLKKLDADVAFLKFSKKVWEYVEKGYY